MRLYVLRLTLSKGFEMWGRFVEVRLIEASSSIAVCASQIGSKCRVSACPGWDIAEQRSL